MTPTAPSQSPDRPAGSADAAAGPAGGHGHNLLISEKRRVRWAASEVAAGDHGPRRRASRSASPSTSPSSDAGGGWSPGTPAGGPSLGGPGARCTARSG